MKATDIDKPEPIDVELEQGNVNEPPAVVTHQVKPNVVEILQEESDDEEPVVEAVVEEVIEPIVEPIVEVDEDEEEIETIVPPEPPTRRSNRSQPDNRRNMNLTLC